MKIRVAVRPNSAKTEVVFVREGQYRVSVSEPPTQNKANVAVVEALAEYLRVPKSLISIVRGQRSKSKTIEIQTTQTLL
ncbi:MAG TPA: DUF167 domain-containing protein [Candidatus Saccharimonadales bacterium]|nr:DUF167 domain-containing protein [Candidatus Saccharimonadales bacterium]